MAVTSPRGSKSQYGGLSTWFPDENGSLIDDAVRQLMWSEDPVKDGFQVCVLHVHVHAWEINESLLIGDGDAGHRSDKAEDGLSGAFVNLMFSGSVDPGFNCGPTDARPARTAGEDRRRRQRARM